MCCLVLRSSCALLLTIQFASFFFFFISYFFPPRFCPGHISGTVTRRLQIECAAWSCGLVVHYCLPSKPLRYFYFFFLFTCHDFVRAISLEPLLADTPNRVCCLVLRSDFALLLTIQFAMLFFFSFFFSATILSRPYLWNRYLQRLQTEFAAWSCGLILYCCLPSNSLRYYFFFFRHDFFFFFLFIFFRRAFFFCRDIFFFNHHYVLFFFRQEFFFFFLFCLEFFFFFFCRDYYYFFFAEIFLFFFLFFFAEIFFLRGFFFFATILSGPYLWNRYSQRLQIECTAWSCSLIVHCCLPSNSLRYFFYIFFFRQDFVRAISMEPLLAETPN